MRNILLAGLAAASLVPAAASAQNYQLRQDGADVHQDRRQLGRDVRNGAGPWRIAQDHADLAADRADSRGDWQAWRRSHPDVYRGGAWVGPNGYAYRPVNVGYRFQPVFYGQRYWVDPYRYHLPVVGPRWRWVRYGRDVVRVDLRSGRAVEVYSGFFY